MNKAKGQTMKTIAEKMQYRHENDTLRAVYFGSKAALSTFLPSTIGMMADEYLIWCEAVAELNALNVFAKLDLVEAGWEFSS